MAGNDYTKIDFSCNKENELKFLGEENELKEDPPHSVFDQCMKWISMNPLDATQS